MVDLAPNNPYGLALRSRVMAAAGCFGYGVEYARLVEIERAGAIVTRSTTLRGRRVARPPQLIETPAGLLAVGAWPDPGLARVVERYAPQWAAWSTPVLLSIVGERPDEYAAIAAALEGVEGIAGLELHLADHTSQAAQIVAAARAATLLPLIAKLPPASEGLAALARAVVGAGADAIALIASPPGLAADPRGGGLVAGRLSGPALRPLALAAVAAVVAAVDAPVIGCGGIATAGDARQFLAAGAVAVQVGAALLADPAALVRIAEELG
ncbi:MAG: dihydroorotate dehydrogenase [Kouleothrix sp.]|nr:dihydroorotate dehydrogenase [Kouleothrix sp.]